MPWQFTAYSYLLFLVAGVAAALIVFAWRRRSAPGAVALAALMAGVFAWSAAYGLELGAVGLAAKVFWAKVSYLGVVSVPLSWLALALDFTGREGWATGRNLAPLAAVPLVTLALVWTNEAHGLVWSSTRVETAGGASALVVGHGAGFWVYWVYAYVLLVTATAVMVPQLARSLRLYRAQGIALLVSTLAPWLGNAAYILGASPVPNLDPTPFAFLVAGLGVAVALFRYRFLDLVPIARESVVEGMGDGVIVVDPGGRVVDLNPAAERMISHRSNEAVGEEAVRLVPGWKELFEGQGRGGTARGEVSDGEGEVRRFYEVRISPVRDRGGLLRGHLALLSDVTGRRRAEEALRESELRLRSIVANVPVILFALDRAGTFGFSEGKGLEALGLAPGQIVGLSVFEVYLENPDILDDVRRALSGEAFSAVRETAGRTFETWYSPLPGPDGALAGTIGVAVDITDRRRAEEEREQRAAELARSNAELEQFAYSVSHDLRAPLRAIAGFSQLLLEDYAAGFDEEGKDYLHRVRDGARRMGQLIDDLLDLSHLTRREMRPVDVDLGALAHKVAADLRRAEPSREVELQIHNVPPARADPHLMEAVLEHLFDNAFKFTSKEPLAWVEFGFDETKGAYYVRDNGAGFDMEYADKLFGAFQRLHGSGEFEGTGIGLATVQRIVHRHGGGRGPRARSAAAPPSSSPCRRLAQRDAPRRGHGP
ncbi:PAS domain-containing protein [Rubrobacter marinus]|uniref:Sensor-like histidine kinase SenX3 n=1 Tax=Rubrobacter marinus TaxID=2653852 RepID=A0A6G8PVK1_9ACTN|nr:histidine kinase N-terminal 7TM domain-containing protein [Rubrobacter marinus]QIN78239.1 PAS domain-containing protein [Rubrobacter marinus]